jgi:crossover junction endodeoxyribonuclease RuvC
MIRHPHSGGDQPKSEKMSNIAGIDPGIEGAYAILDPSGNVVIAGKLHVFQAGTKQLVDARKLWRDLRDYGVVHTIIENVATRPHQGVVSSGNFMKAVGAIYGAAQINGSMSWVTPQSWKRHFDLLGTDKEASRTKALATWPDQEVFFTPKRLFLTKRAAQDAAEAALIARWYHETGGKTVRQLAALARARERGLISL